MYLIDFFKNAIKDKNIKAIAFLMFSMALNISLFWLIYEKWLGRPNGIVIGVGLYLVMLFIFSSPITTMLYFSFYPRGIRKDNRCCPNARYLFERIKNGYSENGFSKAHSVSFEILDSEFLEDSNDLHIIGNKFCVNSMADHCDYSFNRGRNIVGIELAMAGYGKGVIVGVAANMPLILFMKIINFTSHLFPKLFFANSAIGEYNRREDQLFSGYILRFINWCGRMCRDNPINLFSLIVERIDGTEYCDDVEAFFENSIDA